MKIIPQKIESKCIEGYKDIRPDSNLHKLLLDVGPIMAESLLNFYAKSGDKRVYRNLIEKKNAPYFSSYINYFNSLEKKLAIVVSNGYEEIQAMKEYELEYVYKVFDSDKDLCAVNVWGEKYNSIVKTRNKILKDEVDASNRLPKLDYVHSVNANYAHSFSYNFKKDLDPRKVKSLLYKKTLKMGQNPETYTNFNLFSLRNKASVGLAFYGRAIEFTDFMDMLNSVDYSYNRKNGGSVKPIL
ncbi:MAG: hypothetical protein ACP5MV_02085 [Candidatus Parvarchaeum sp.]